MAKPQIREVRDAAGRPSLWYYTPSTPGAAEDVLEAETQAFINQIAPGADIHDNAYGEYRDKPPGTETDQGHWYKPRIPIGQQQQYPATGAFPDNDTARRDAYRTWGEKQGPLSGMRDVEARMVMARFVENYEGKPGGYTLVPQPGGLVNIGLPDKLPPGLTAEQQVLFEQKKELGQLQIDAAKRAADLEIAGGITGAGFRAGTEFDYEKNYEALGDNQTNFIISAMRLRDSDETHPVAQAAGHETIGAHFKQIFANAQIGNETDGTSLYQQILDAYGPDNLPLEMAKHYSPNVLATYQESQQQENVVQTDDGFFYKTGRDSWTFRESPQQAPYADPIVPIDGGAGGQLVQTSPTGYQLPD
jgi:hypothetical protein